MACSVAPKDPTGFVTPILRPRSFESFRRSPSLPSRHPSPSFCKGGEKREAQTLPQNGSFGPACASSPPPPPFISEKRAGQTWASSETFSLERDWGGRCCTQKAKPLWPCAAFPFSDSPRFARGSEIDPPQTMRGAGGARRRGGVLLAMTPPPRGQSAAARGATEANDRRGGAGL